MSKKKFCTRATSPSDQARAFHCFLSLGWDASLFHGYPPFPQNFIRILWQFASTHLNSWVKRGTVWVCFVQEHNTMTWTSQAGFQHSKYKGTKSPTHNEYAFYDVLVLPLFFTEVWYALIFWCIVSERGPTLLMTKYSSDIYIHIWVYAKAKWHNSKVITSVSWRPSKNSLFCLIFSRRFFSYSDNSPLPWAFLGKHRRCK